MLNTPNTEENVKQTILIVDDSEMNRFILSDMLSDEFEILEAKNGKDAIAVLRKLDNAVSLVLLDIVMPEMDGFEVLAYMNKYHWIDDIPVIMISSETAPSAIEYAYDMGVTDFISRPFDAAVVRRRSVNTIMLYAKQKKLMDIVAEQIYQKQKSNSLMIEILSHIVEFRNGESGLHVQHISVMTEILLKRLIQKTDKYGLTSSDIQLISVASALHDIGKIGIPDHILNKPGRFTPEEFEIMKTHSALGAGMLEQVPFHQNEPLVKVAYEICRWHHERYDGKGYPDGLKGEEIPISAQIVSIADVYDALTSERCYKKAFTHEKAMEMILNGECGAFNPELLDCLKDVADILRDELKVNSIGHAEKANIENLTEEIMNLEELSGAERTLKALEHERSKYHFYAHSTDEIWFEFTADPPMLTFSEKGASILGLPEAIIDPVSNQLTLDVFTAENMYMIRDAIKSHFAETDDNFVFDCTINVAGEKRDCRIVIGVAPDKSNSEYNDIYDLFGKVVLK